MELLIKQIMKSKGITILSLAERLGLSQPATSLRVNSPNPSLNSLIEIANALEVHVADLFPVADDYCHWSQKPHPLFGKPHYICPNCGMELVITKYGK